MRKAAVIFTGLLLLVASACGPQTQDGDEPAVPGTDANGFLGSVTYQYDPVLLTSANVRIAIPPGENDEAYAVKLIPARGVEGSPDMCADGAGTCPVESQPGVTLALLEQPFERYQEALQSSGLADEIAPSTVAGVQGIAIDGGSEDGLDVEYRLVPVNNRALLIKLQRDGQSPAEEEALAEVIESLDLGD